MNVGRDYGNTSILTARAPWPRRGVINVSRPGISWSDVDHAPLDSASAEKDASARAELAELPPGIDPGEHSRYERAL